MLPLVSVDVIALPFMLTLSTSRSVLITTVPVPFGDRFILPLLSVEDIVFVTTLRLPTLISPLTSTPSAVVSIFFTLLWYRLTAPLTSISIYFSVPVLLCTVIPSPCTVSSPVVFTTLVFVPSCLIVRSSPVPTTILALSAKSNALALSSHVIS